MAVTVASLTADATLVVDVCMSVEEGDNVTIICDDDHADQAKAVADICVERGAFPVIMNNETQVRRGRAVSREKCRQRLAMREIEPAAPGHQEFAAGRRHAVIDRHLRAAV